MPLKPIELISFKLCPFVQRSVITLKKKGIDFTITYIDLANKPDWFLEISPLGKVPVVRYGDEVLFESAIINEFLDEITHNRLMPEAPLTKAKDRAWIEFASQALGTQYTMSIASDVDEYEKHTTTLSQKLELLEREASGEKYFRKSQFSLLDSALAPLFTRLHIWHRALGKNLLSDFPKLQSLSDNYLALDYVKASVVDDFEALYLRYMTDRNSLLVS